MPIGNEQKKKRGREGEGVRKKENIKERKKKKKRGWMEKSILYYEHKKNVRKM